MTVGTLGAIVLAAGGSTRLGHSKQLVVHEGRALVVRAVDAAREAGAHPVVVVLGAEADAVDAVLRQRAVVRVVNPRWADGVGTSLAAGLSAIVEHAPAVHGVLIALADQPLVDGASLERLMTAWRAADARATGSEEPLTIAAATYAGTVGVPAIFGRAHFAALRALPPASGASVLLRTAGGRVIEVGIPEAAIDVDTPDDLARLRGPAA